MIIASNPCIYMNTTATTYTLPKDEGSCHYDHSNNDTTNTDGYVKISNGKPQQLPSSYKPGQYDVICGRGKAAFNHSGNKYFRTLIQKYQVDFGIATSRMERMIVVTNIVDAVRAKGMGFVKKEKDGHYWQIGDRLSREKIGTLLREAQGSRYSSSSQAKKNRKRQQAEAALCNSNDSVNCNIQNVVFSNSQVVSTLSNVTSILLNNDSSSMTDDDILDMFTKANCIMLSAMKSDETLLQRFHGAQQQQQQVACQQGTFVDDDEMTEVSSSSSSSSSSSDESISVDECYSMVME